MKDFLQSLSDPMFMPHGHCYLWKPDILWTHVLSDGTIALAYYAIPLVLGIFLSKTKQNVPYREILALFVAFIFLCGTTHLVNIYVTWYPWYESQGYLKASTAIVSLVTAILLIPRLPKMVQMPGVQQAYEKSLVTLEEVKAEKAEMEFVYQNTMDRETKILALKEEVNTLLSELNREAKYNVSSDSLK